MPAIVTERDRNVLYDLDVDDPLPKRCTVKAWQPAVAGITEAFHAHIVDYAYPPHCHDTWTVLIVDYGEIDYALDTKRCGAAPATVAVLPPGVIHDGRPSTGAEQGFWKRNLYLEPDFLPAALIGAAVDKTTIDDPGLRHRISRLHDCLVAGEEPIDGEGRLALIAERLRSHLEPSVGSAPPSEIEIAKQLRRFLDANACQSVALSDAATALERSVAHLVRSFTTAYAVSPHAYLIGRRIEAARPLLLQGMAPAEVASTVGFYDQAHLTRHFKRHTSTTPGRYARSHR